MKLPFFRSSKAVAANRIPAVSRHTTVSERTSRLPATPTSGGKGATQRITELQPPPPPQVVPHAAAEETIPICLRSIVSQLPARLFAPGVNLHASTVQLAIPCAWVLPQLQSGRVNVKLGDLIRLLPAALLQKPLPVIPEQQLIALPLPEIIAALPDTAFQVQHETAIELDSKEFTELPALFDDEFVQSCVPAQPAEATPAPVTTPPAAPAEAPVPAPTADEEQVLVSLRSLVAALPETVFCCPRAEVGQRVNLDARVPLPAAPLIPQLSTGRLRLPVETVVSALPPEILSPTAAAHDEQVALPLPEIVPQLSAHLFTTAAEQQTAPELGLDEQDIPVPFAEKSDAAPPAAEPAVPALEISPLIADENLTVFAEKSAPIPVAPAAVPEPTPVAADEPAPPAPAAIAEDDVPATVFAEVPAEVPAVPTPAPTAAEPPPVAPTAIPPLAPEAAGSTGAATESPAEEPVPAASVPTEQPIDEKRFLVNINRCAVEDLLSIEGIGSALARRIIEYREAHGGFRSLDELRQIPGIGRKTFRALAGSAPRSLNQLLGAPVDRELTLQEVVQYTAKLPGVDGVVLAMANGLFLTGQVPTDYDQNAISVFAPQLFKKMGRYTRELRVGQVQRITIFTDQRPISIFQAGEVYLVIIHDTRRFSKALLRRCERISRGIAGLCRQRAAI